MQPTTFFEQCIALTGIRDGDTSRSLIAALVALGIFSLTAPRERKWLARGPALLLVLAVLPLVAAMLFPEEADAGKAAALGVRLFVLAALFQAIVLVALVSFWGRLVRPASTILLDVLRWLAAMAALAERTGLASIFGL